MDRFSSTWVAHRLPIAAIVAGGLFVLSAGGLAGADPPSASDPTAWVTDGTVHAIARAGDRTYIGGEFARVGPRTGPAAALQPPGTSDPAASIPGFPEVGGGVVRAVIPDGSGGWYLGGDFTQVGGQPRSGLAQVTSSGSVTGWNPVVEMPGGTAEPGVHALARSPVGPDAGIVYVGGRFNKAGGANRTNAVAIDTAGQATSWAPNPDSTVRALLVRRVDATVYTRQGAPTSDDVATLTTMSLVIAGGDFASAGGQSSLGNLAAIWGVGAVKSSTSPNPESTAGVVSGTWIGSSNKPVGTVRTLAAGPTTTVTVTSFPCSAASPCRQLNSVIYVGGDFLNKPNANNYLAAYQLPVMLDQNDAANPIIGTGSFYVGWLPKANGPVRAVAVGGDGAVFAGGDFTLLGDAAPQPTRNRLGKLAGVPQALAGNNQCTSGATGTCPALAQSWNPGALGPEPDSTARVRALGLTPDGTHIYAGGDFSTAGGATRNNLALLPATGTGAATTPEAAWDARSAGGPVHAVAAQADAVFAAGAFSSVGATKRANLAALDADGELIPDFAPEPDGSVYALTAGGERLYVGGAFKNIAGAERSSLAALEPDGTAVPDWAPDPDKAVLALDLAAPDLYVGGSFDEVDGTSRRRVAAVDAATGQLTGFDPQASGTPLEEPVSVRAIDASCATVYVGGSFTRIGGAERERIASLNPLTGAADGWKSGATSTVFAIERSGPNVYVGGAFSVIGDAVRQRIAAVDAVTGKATAWNPAADYTVRALSASGTDSPIYVGGSFNEVGGAGRNRLAAIDRTTGLATGFDAGVNDTIYALESESDNLYAGGDFGRAGVRLQQGFAQFTAGPPSESDGSQVCARAGDGVGQNGDAGGASTPATSGDVDLGGYGERPPAAADGTPPSVGRVGLTTRRFAVGSEPTPLSAENHGSRDKRSRGEGTTFEYGLSEDAAVTIAIERRNRRCARSRTSAAKTRRRARRCKRTTAVGALTRAGKRGANETPFSGRIGTKPLKPGRYRAKITAKDAAGNKSRPRTASFTVVR